MLFDLRGWVWSVGRLTSSGWEAVEEGEGVDLSAAERRPFGFEDVWVEVGADELVVGCDGAEAIEGRAGDREDSGCLATIESAPEVI